MKAKKGLAILLTAALLIGSGPLESIAAQGMWRSGSGHGHESRETTVSAEEESASIGLSGEAEAEELDSINGASDDADTSKADAGSETSDRSGTVESGEVTDDFSDSDWVITEGQAYINPIYIDEITEEDITIPDEEDILAAAEAGSGSDNGSGTDDGSGAGVGSSKESAGNAEGAGDSETEDNVPAGSVSGRAANAGVSTASDGLDGDSETASDDDSETSSDGASETASDDTTSYDTTEIASDDVSETVSEDSSDTEENDTETIIYYKTVKEAAEVLRAGMKAREASIVVYYYGEVYSSDYFKELCTEYIIPGALAETDQADEGDYLRYNYGGTGYGAAINKDSNGDLRYYTITFTPTYFTTAEQEAEVDEKVEELLAEEFAFTEDTCAYEQIYEVYDYICSNVTYDYDSTTTTKYTAYAALINKTAVCQGYAALCYRLLRELGLGVRVATGYGGVSSEDESNYYENHAWNVIQIDGKWYYADSTWDANFSDVVAEGTYTYQYFLRGTTDFDDLAASYTTTGIHYLIMDSDFTDTYSIEETRYHHYVSVVTVPTCMEGGYTTYTCTLCGESYTADETKACGHTWDEGTVTKEATTTEEGIRTCTCTVCGEMKTEVIEKLAEKVISAPSVSLTATQNNGKIKLTANITGYGDTDNYYEVIGEGFVYITKAKLGSKSLSVNTSGRTKVTISSATAAAKYSYSMTPASSSTTYVIRAWITYKNSAGKTVYVYSDPIYTSYNALAQ